MANSKLIIINGELQIRINIDQPIWSENCVVLCKKELLKYKDISNYNSVKVSITATSKVDDVDISFIAFLTLVISQYSNLKIFLDFKINNYQENTELAGKINQYMAHSEIMRGKKVFTFNYGERSFANITESNFIWSEDFFPIIFIDNSTIDKTCLREYEVRNYASSYDVNDENFYQNCRRMILNKGEIQIDDLIDLGYLYVFKTLKILNIIYDENYSSSKIVNHTLRAGSLTGKDAYRYYDKIKPVVDILKQKPPIYLFLFSVIFSAEMTLPKNEESIDEKAKLLHKILSFTNETAYGIIELARNICQHSSTKRGVISGRVYRKEKVLNFYKYSHQLENVLESYCSNYKDDIYFLLLNIIDDGEVGVVETLKRKINKSSDDAISVNSYNFYSLFTLSSKMLLSHQAKRATAHMGLLLFSKLIRENNGFLRASTWKGTEIFEKGTPQKMLREDFILSNKIETAVPLPKVGTWYQILLPFDKKKKLSPQFESSIQLPQEVSIAQLNLFESFLHVKVITSNEEIEDDRKLSYLFNIDLNQNHLKDRDDEVKLWNDIQGNLKGEINTALLNRETTIYICLNLEKVKIHPSALLRLLGVWELIYTNSPIVIYNLSNDQYQGFIDLNNLFCEVSEIPLWNKESGVLFYNYITQEDERFYFTNLLWGEDYADFSYANSIIRKTNFTNKLTKSASGSKNKKLLSSLKIFLKTYLFPFDIFLTTHERISLFENNAKAIINNEMK